MKLRGEEHRFVNEAELCKTFIEDLPKDWTAYPETSGFDIVIVRSDGFQIGVQAKMAMNAKVISQSLCERPSSACDPGPDCRAVLIPEYCNIADWLPITSYVGVTIITCRKKVVPYSFPKTRYRPFLPEQSDTLPWYQSRMWHDDFPLERLKLPDYIPDVVAGAPAPTRLTDWKVRALRITVILEMAGSVTRADFKDMQIDPRRWTTPGQRWLVKEGNGFIKGPYYPDFRKQHPSVFEQIKADREKWMPKRVLEVVNERERETKGRDAGGISKP